MSIDRNVRDVPDVTFEYWSIIDFMATNPGMYIMEMRRSECHERLCKYYNISKKISKIVTDNLNRYEDIIEIHDALTILGK